MTPVQAPSAPDSDKKHLRLAAQATTARIAYFDHEGRYLWANGSELERVGRSMDQVLGRLMAEVVGSLQYERIAEKFELSLRGHALCFEVSELEGGVDRRWQLSYAPERGDDGRVKSMVAVAIDTTAQRAAQSALQESDRLVRLAVQAADLGTWDWDVVADRGRWSTPRLGWANAGPWAGEDAKLSDFLRYVHAEDAQRLKESISHALAFGGVLDAQFRVSLPGGAAAWFAATGHVFFDTSGRAARVLGILRDVTAKRRDQEEREALIQALQAEHERLRVSEHGYRALFEELSRQQGERETIFDRVPAMIWHKDADNRVIRCNRAAAASRGLTVEQMEGKSTRDLFPEQADKLYADDLEVLASGKPKLGILGQMLDAKGRKRWTQTDKIPHFDPRGKTVGVIVFSVDITDRMRAEEVLRESERSQRDFVANVSHEFRTPVAAIKGFAETLRRGGLEDKKNRQRFVRIIERHAERLGALIESLLTLSTIESGMIKLSPEDVDLRRFVDDYVESIGTLLRRKGVCAFVRIPAGLRARADAPMLLQVLENLFGNAIKFNRAGGSIAVSARGVRGCRVQVTVRDTGHGIPAKDLPRVFDRFFKGSNDPGAFGSTGLGLHLVKKIVESHGGRVWAESRPRRGSAFHFTLPRALRAS